MMVERGAALPKKSRAKGSKSKGGCYTCKVRHLKCDEARPVCLRCGKTGRLCEGLGYGKTPHMHHVECTGSPSSTLPHRLLQSREEYRYFEYFCRYVLHRLTGFDYQSKFWNEIVPQFSESSPAVLHAVLALSALYEYLDDNSKGTHIWDKLILKQYNRSIRCLRLAPSPQPIQFTLTCCILFITFESAQDDYQNALLHLQSGLDILKDWRTKEIKSFLEGQDREVISETFRRFDMQATTFLNSRQPHLIATADVKSLDRNFCLPMLFSSLHDAQASLENIEIRLFYILTAKPSTLHQSWLQYGDLTATKPVLLRGLKVQFLQWRKTFDTYFNNEKKNMKARDLQLALLLELHHQTTSLMLDLKAELSPRSSVDTQCTIINELSKALIHSFSTSKLTFLADTGIIGPLYFAAISTTNAHIRHQSISLLKSVSWKEGLWDSKIVVQIAENLPIVKEPGIVGVAVTGGVPELAKVYVPFSISIISQGPDSLRSS
ncbi:hypothetical protein GGI35DRAFT_112102 [Trichoderma velutinum]